MTRILPAKHRDLQFKDLYSDPALAAFLATMLVPEYRGKEPPPPQLVRKVDTELRVPGDGFVRADLLWRMPFPDLEHFFYFRGTFKTQSRMHKDCIRFLEKVSG